MSADYSSSLITQLKSRSRQTRGATVAERIEDEKRDQAPRTGGRQKTGRTELLGVRLTPDMVKSVKSEASTRDILIAEVIEEAMALYFKQRGKRQ